MSQQTINAEIMEISPDLAKLLLEGNSRNRNISPDRVNAISKDILDGKWVFDGAPIRIAENGKLLDGQHRLTAIAKSGVSVQSLVIRGLSDGSAVTMDSGRSRSLGDYLKMTGEKDSAVLATSIRACMGVHQDGLVKDRFAVPSNQESVQFLKDHPEVRECAAVGRRVSGAFPAIPLSVVAGFYFLFSKIDKEDADYFFQELVKPSHSEGSPILALRECLIAKKLSNKHTGGRVSRHWQSGVILKSWNAFREGREIKTLRFNPGGAKKETAPKAI